MLQPRVGVASGLRQQRDGGADSRLCRDPKYCQLREAISRAYEEFSINDINDNNSRSIDLTPPSAASASSSSPTATPAGGRTSYPLTRTRSSHQVPAMDLLAAPGPGRRMTESEWVALGDRLITSRSAAAFRASMARLCFRNANSRKPSATEAGVLATFLPHSSNLDAQDVKDLVAYSAFDSASPKYERYDRAYSPVHLGLAHPDGLVTVKSRLTRKRVDGRLVDHKRVTHYQLNLTRYTPTPADLPATLKGLSLNCADTAYGTTGRAFTC